MEAAILAAISTLLTTAETVLPAIAGTSATGTVISTVVVALEKWVPIVVAEMPAATGLFSSIKNIIAALSSNPAATADQLATLQQLDAQVDTAFEAAAAAVDPDKTPPAA